ncbi:unnamed protein product [Penicillium pancosmium]
MSPSCGMVCGEDGPFSPLRQGAADNIYVIPVPHALTFNTATLISAACCVPAILSLVSTWIKILEYNWETFSSRYVNSTNSTESTEKSDERPIKGTNGATPKQMNGIAARIRGWLTLIEIPVFVAAVLAILVKGEMNFFSEPVNYQTEPITSIGQWAPIVGTGLAAIGSLYVLFAATMDADESENDDQEIRLDADANADASEHDSNCTEYTSRGNSPESLDSISPQRSSQMIDRSPSKEIVRTTTQASISPKLPRTTTNQSERSVHSGGRRKGITPKDFQAFRKSQAKFFGMKIYQRFKELILRSLAPELAALLGPSRLMEKAAHEYHWKFRDIFHYQGHQLRRVQSRDHGMLIHCHQEVGHVQFLEGILVTLLMRFRLLETRV